MIEWEEKEYCFIEERGRNFSHYHEKLQILQSHYEHLGKVSEGSDFDDDWKEEVEDRVNNCKCASETQSCMRMRC